MTDIDDSQTTLKARWYIVHTYSGFENRVEQTIREMMRTEQDQGYIKEVVIPTEKVIELVRGEKKTFTRKFYPGYVMIRMEMNDFSWHLVQSVVGQRLAGGVDPAYDAQLGRDVVQDAGMQGFGTHVGFLFAGSSRWMSCRPPQVPQ